MVNAILQVISAIMVNFHVSLDHVMFVENQTKVTHFLFLGFQNLQIVNFLIFVVILVIYLMTLVGNLLIIILVVKVPSLKTPMYFFLTHLSLSDILLTTDIVPNMLHVILNGGSTISIAGCIIQLYFYGVSTAAECILLTLMSYDRYLAICNPLHYTSIMDLHLQFLMVISTWIFGFMFMLLFVLLVCKIQFCGSQIIDHYFCDLAPLLDLSCSDDTVIKLINFVTIILFMILPFSFILSTYIAIFITIFGISSTNGKQKAFSTCSSHLIVVSTYYGTLITVYLAPSEGQSFNMKKIISLLYIIATPFLNPVIYSLKNQEIKSALKSYFRIKKYSSDEDDDGGPCSFAQILIIITRLKFSVQM
ncbi:olfactory receptor 10A7-like [Pelodytes ibericus]